MRQTAILREFYEILDEKERLLLTGYISRPDFEVLSETFDEITNPERNGSKD